MVAIARRAVLLLWILMGLASPLGAEQPLTVFAAASLKTALDQADEAFTAETAIPVRASYAASSALAKQIAQGAPADVYASADVDWMDDLDSRKLVLAGTRVDLLGNRLVVIAANDSPVSTLALDPPSFTSALGGRRLALAEVTSVPAGRYAKAALQNLGIWEKLRPHLAMAENVRAALRFVSRGEAPLGIVYATDAAADPEVKIVATFPADSHPPIVYPFAAAADGNAERAREYLEFLQGPSARAVFEKQGFTVLPGGG
ncbi:MAG: molybdate ABC transporter substrate-binding protein [Alphaproteobacteria bacterium]|nr:MAG: molybdate ABC transporter substrate-binding protein [Alphaproteobacteria bacterium]